MCNAVHYCRTTLYAWLASIVIIVELIIFCSGYVGSLYAANYIYTYTTAAIFIIHTACIPYHYTEIIVMLNSVCSMVTVRMWLHAVHDHRWSIFAMMYMWVYYR